MSNIYCFLFLYQVYSLFSTTKSKHLFEPNAVKLSYEALWHRSAPKWTVLVRVFNQQPCCKWTNERCSHGLDWSSGESQTSSLDKSIHWLLAIGTDGVFTSPKTAAIDPNSVSTTRSANLTSFLILEKLFNCDKKHHCPKIIYFYQAISWPKSWSYREPLPFCWFLMFLGILKMKIKQACFKILL